ncbi:hypothetical protein AB0903_18325 [Streptomyces sp. NPDC048389]|uniref:hypothetical protein n=1 Tax=Streptomyces sp. NPDC048389 TaxID=3154622 RepID=UPI0034539CD6
MLEQLRGQVEKHSSLGADLKRPVKDWSEVGAIVLRAPADRIDKAAKSYTLKV